MCQTIGEEEEEHPDIARRARNPAPPAFTPISYAPSDGLRLATRFADSGLQVIVKIVSIELTPEKPSFPAGGWHIEGNNFTHLLSFSVFSQPTNTASHPKKAK